MAPDGGQAPPCGIDSQTAWPLLSRYAQQVGGSVVVVVVVVVVVLVVVVVPPHVPATT